MYRHSVGKAELMVQGARVTVVLQSYEALLHTTQVCMCKKAVPVELYTLESSCRRRRAGCRCRCNAASGCRRAGRVASTRHPTFHATGHPPVPRCSTVRQRAEAPHRFFLPFRAPPWCRTWTLELIEFSSHVQPQLTVSRPSSCTFLCSTCTSTLAVVGGHCHHAALSIVSPYT